MRKTWLLTACILGMGLSGAVLVVLIPSLFGSGDKGSVWVAVGVLGFLVLAFGAGVRYWKRSFPIAGDDR